MTPPGEPPGWSAELEARLRALGESEETKLGFPGWSAPLPKELVPFFSYELNNYGDTLVDPVFPWHVKDLERELINMLADLFAAPPNDRWGYVTSGSSEAILYGLWLGRTLQPAANVYCSRAAHPCVLKNVHLLDRRAVLVPTDGRGEMSYIALREMLLADDATSAIVLATIGTTLTEAVDDVKQIKEVLRGMGIRRHYVHVDGALSAIPLAASLDEPPAFGIHSLGADSISVSGHKFLAAPFPCGIVLTRAVHRHRLPRFAEYTGSSEPTITSSRSGHAALVLWHRLRTYGPKGLRRMAEQTRSTAAYAEQLLRGIGWRAWRAQPYACTVLLQTPPKDVLQRWPMPSVDGLSHLVCTPGVTRERVARFVMELRANLTARTLDPPPQRQPGELAMTAPEPL